MCVSVVVRLQLRARRMPIAHKSVASQSASCCFQKINTVKSPRKPCLRVDEPPHGAARGLDEGGELLWFFSIILIHVCVCVHVCDLACVRDLVYMPAVGMLSHAGVRCACTCHPYVCFSLIWRVFRILFEVVGAEAVAQASRQPQAPIRIGMQIHTFSIHA